KKRQGGFRAVHCEPFTIVRLRPQTLCITGPMLNGLPNADPPKLDPMQLVLHASIPVKLVIIVLVAFSLLCWVVIFAKALHIGRARGDSEKFMKAFDSAGTLDGLAQQGLAAF